MRRAASALLLIAALAAGSAAQAQEEKPKEAPPAKAAAPEKPAPVAFGDDLAAAQATARAEGKPLLVVAVPDWYACPEAQRLREEVLASDAAREKLDGFVRVLVEESPDREVHVRHRVAARGYPLAVVLSAKGDFLGSTSGLPSEDAASAWPARIAEIPARHARIKALQAKLREEPESPAMLLELAGLHLENREADRADALLARLDAADPEDASGLLGEARFLRLRIANAKLLATKQFTEVEPLCNKWLRRFREHARRPDVLLLRANALYLTDKKDDARALWKEIGEEHPKTNAAKRAKKALSELGAKDES
jgi:hypothetical protein